MAFAARSRVLGSLGRWLGGDGSRGRPRRRRLRTWEPQAPARGRRSWPLLSLTASRSLRAERRSSPWPRPRAASERRVNVHVAAVRGRERVIAPLSPSFAPLRSPRENWGVSSRPRPGTPWPGGGEGGGLGLPRGAGFGLSDVSGRWEQAFGGVGGRWGGSEWIWDGICTRRSLPRHRGVVELMGLNHFSVLGRKK